MADRHRPDVGLQPRDRLERNQPPRIRTDVQQRHRRRIVLKLRRHLQDDLVLVVRRVDLRDLSRAVGVVQRVLDLVRRESQRRDLVPVHVDRDLRVLQQQVAADVLQPRQLPDLFLHQRRVLVQLGGVGVLQRELIQRALTALSRAEIDRRLIGHERPDAGNLRDLRPQLRDGLIDRQRPLVARLQLDPDAAGVQRAAAVADGANHHVGAGHVRVLREHLGHLHLVARHVVEADALRRFRVHHEPALILAREEPFRHDREQVHGADEQHDRDRHRHGAEAQASAAATSRTAAATRRTSARTRCRSSHGAARGSVSGTGCTASG